MENPRSYKINKDNGSLYVDYDEGHMAVFGVSEDIKSSRNEGICYLIFTAWEEARQA